MRKEYEMTQEELNKILEACRPVPMIMSYDRLDGISVVFKKII